MKPTPQVLEVWGDYACFSRPEMKVERFSYPVITPSAARGIFDAIYVNRHEFRWRITEIEVLTPPSYIALRRNEVKEKANVAAVFRWMTGREHPEPILADADKKVTGTDTRGRTQRQTMALRDVRYRIHAEIRMWGGDDDRLVASEAKFRRRAARGQCVYQPYLGCREFPAYFALIETSEQVAPPLALDLDIGLMLYDVFALSRPGEANDAAAISLFRAAVRNGVLQVPDYASPAVVKPGGRAG